MKRDLDTARSVIWITSTGIYPVTFEGCLSKIKNIIPKICNP